MYSSPFYISEAISNNAFSYEKRKLLLSKKTQLFVPSAKIGNIEDLQLSEKICFQEIDEHGKLQSCSGLQNFIETSLCGTPAIIVDNHNHVFYFWWKWFLKKHISSQPLSLLHIDQHADMSVPKSILNSKDLEDIFEYTNTHLHIANFIVPAQKMGLINEVIQIRSEHKLLEISKNFSSEKTPPFILDIDIDFFVSNIGTISFNEKKSLILTLSQKAEFISIATSPFFIHQEKALQIIQKIYGDD